MYFFLMEVGMAPVPKPEPVPESPTVLAQETPSASQESTVDAILINEMAKVLKAVETADQHLRESFKELAEIDNKHITELIKAQMVTEAELEVVDEPAPSPEPKPEPVVQFKKTVGEEIAHKKSKKPQVRRARS